jgi:ABC-type glutathione transport system ATPase component
VLAATTSSLRAEQDPRVRTQIQAAQIAADPPTQPAPTGGSSRKNHPFVCSDPCHQTPHLSLRDTSQTPDGEKEILHSMSGHITPGTLCCIVGPSGAGKTTLMNALCARLLKGVEGHIVIDGDAISRDRAASLVSRPSLSKEFVANSASVSTTRSRFSTARVLREGPALRTCPRVHVSMLALFSQSPTCVVEVVPGSTRPAPHLV